MDKKDKVREGLGRITTLEGIMPTSRAVTLEARLGWATVGGNIEAHDIRAADVLSDTLLKSSLPTDIVRDTAIESLFDSEDALEQVAGFARAGIGFFRASDAYLASSIENRRERGGNEAITRVVTDGPRILLETQRLIVQFQQDCPEPFIESILCRHALFPIDRGGLPPGLMRVACAAESAIQVAFALMEDDAVMFAEPDFVEHIGARHTPGDPDYVRQWHHARMSVDRAWDTSRGAGIRVAVIDNGFDAKHPDLAFDGLSGWFRATPDFVDADFVGGLAHMPGSTHGTSCAGMIAAREGNGIGGCGVAFDCALMAIACANDQVGTQSTLARALAYAVQPALEGMEGPGADIVCCSLGPNHAAWTMRQVLAEAIDFASTSGRDGLGTAIFWATTNGNHPIAADEVCSHPQVIAVGRSSESDRDDGSGFGDELDFLAPGVSVWLPAQGGGHHYEKGTSFAAPAAAGVAALALSVYPSLSAEALRQRLRDCCDKVGPLAYPQGRNTRYGFGRLNALKAVA